MPGTNCNREPCFHRGVGYVRLEEVGLIQPSALEAAIAQSGRSLVLFDETPVFSRTLRRTLRAARRAMLPLGHDRHLPQWANRFLVPPIRTRDNALRKVNPRFQKEDRQEGAMMRRENALRPKRRRTVTTTHSGTTIWPWKVGMLLSIGTSIFCLGIFWRTNRVPLQK